jgi:hypothetical protein
MWPASVPMMLICCAVMTGSDIVPIAGSAAIGRRNSSSSQSYCSTIGKTHRTHEASASARGGALLRVAHGR